MVRDSLTAVISTLGFPGQGICIFCKHAAIAVWCPDCSANAYLCEACAQDLHSEINLFHTPMLWEVSSNPVTTLLKIGCYHNTPLFVQ